MFLQKNFFKINTLTINLKNIRPINIYTRRGIRLSKQPLFKKIGKKTS